MASNSGWIKVHREILNHPLVGAGQPVPPADPLRGSYSRLEAWLWLIMNASFEDHWVMNRGRKMTLQRGDLLGGWLFLAQTFNWSQKTVRTWIEKLIADQMICRRTIELQIEHHGGQSELGTQPGKQSEDKKGNQVQVLTIQNYNAYQDFGGFSGASKVDGDRASKKASEGQANGKQTATHKEGKEGKEGKKTPPVSPPLGGGDILTKFEEFWALFPAAPFRKLGKQEALRIFRQIVTGQKSHTSKGKKKVDGLPQTSAEDLLDAVKRYAASKPDPDFAPAPITWLNQGRWLDDIPSGNAATAAAQQMPWWMNPEKLRGMDDDRWRSGIAKYANGIWPIDKLGPAPGNPKCVVPRALITEMRLDEIYTPQGMKRR